MPEFDFHDSNEVSIEVKKEAVRLAIVPMRMIVDAIAKPKRRDVDARIFLSEVFLHLPLISITMSLGGSPPNPSSRHVTE